MSHLATDLRNLLERAVVEARDVAELGARAALEALGVSDGKVHVHLKPEERDLRVRLRARARQLGDTLDAKTQVQAVDHLVREVAYEHWHRMLFARFLAESHLLVEPESGVAVSLEECRELAQERGGDPWALAGRFAERMLPAIFRSNDPALALALPPERLNRLEALLEALPAEVFAADDALGWVYQFWQKEEKERVNKRAKSGLKVGADELPAVTQLFTEPYMVQFLLHNTLGAWHAGKVLAAQPDLATTAASEDELRRACALPGYEWTHLRFLRDPPETGPWRPAAGAFPGWPTRVAAVTFMDPYCGSGHFLVEALSAFVALRRSEDGLDLPRAVRSVLNDNLHGLEIDSRCTQLAAFAVAFAAWRKLGRIEPLPPIQIACCGLAVGVPKSEWLRLAGDEPDLRVGMGRLHDLFQKAPTLGSLLDPRREISDDLFSASLDRLEGHLLGALGEEDVQRDAAATEIAVAAAGMALAVERLLDRYTLIATNVPYLKRGKQVPSLQDYCEAFHSDARGNLACTCVDRALGLLAPGGAVAVVAINELLSLGTYQRFRTRLLSESTWYFVARLGPGAFETVGGEVVNVCLLGLGKEKTGEARFATLDASDQSSPRKKALALGEGSVTMAAQMEQLRNPDSRVVLGGVQEGFDLLSKYVVPGKGSTTGDTEHYHRFFWEFQVTPPNAVHWLDSPTEGAHWSGRELICIVSLDDAGLREEKGAWIRGQEVWGRSGVAVAKMSDLQAFMYSGEVFDDNIGALVPSDPNLLPALLAFCESPAYSQAIREIDQAIKITAGTLAKVPFDRAHWEDEARERYPNGLPEPWSEDPSQWIFHGHPARSAVPLQVTVARLLGYRWPAELDPEMRLASEAREWVKRSEALVGLADCDGIVCLSSLRNEEPATERLRGLLSAAFGKDRSATKERELLAATPGRAANLEEWLRDRFFEEHCALFHQRPFIWHIWDGRKDGFHALVNYHRLAEGNGKGRQLLDKLTHDYLGEWIDRQRRSAAAGETGAEARLAAAVDLQGELKRILDGEPPYDIFVRWKALHRQPIGWEPDIDDGVRLNARPFLTATLSAGRAGAGLFRAKPNIHWKKDRGAEPQRDRADFPWFYGSDGKFHGERHNDLHLSLDEKRRAREAKAKGGAKR